MGAEIRPNGPVGDALVPDRRSWPDGRDPAFVSAPTAALLAPERVGAAMLSEDDLAPGWRVWSDAEDKLVLAYRPDVFDGGAFPPPCLPTLYVTQGARNRRPGHDPNPSPGASWHVTLFLEPDVNREPDRYDARAAAAEGARELAADFAAGEVDYRALYQVPREDYFAKLDELTGRET